MFLWAREWDHRKNPEVLSDGRGAILGPVVGERSKHIG